MSETENWKRYAAELIGTFVLVFIGCGSSVIAAGYLGVIAVPLAFGFSVLALTYAIGGLSGCHINPAVSISLLAAGKMKPKDTVLYVLMQCLGAVVGAVVLYWILVGNPNYSLASNGLGQNGYGAFSAYGFSVFSCFVAEAALAFIFLLIFFGSTSEKAPKGFAGVAIGFSYGMIYLVSMPITGGSVNPARSLGPAVVLAVFAGKAGLDAWNQLWLFWAAPILGGLICAGVWRFLEQERNTLDVEPTQDPSGAD